MTAAICWRSCSSLAQFSNLEKACARPRTALHAPCMFITRLWEAPRAYQPVPAAIPCGSETVDLPSLSLTVIHHNATTKSTRNQPQRPRPCPDAGSYKGLAFTSCAYSGDGSLLAIATPSSITLWDPLTNSLAAVLPLPAAVADSFVRRVEFVAGAPLLVATTAGRQVRAQPLLARSIDCRLN